MTEARKLNNIPGRIRQHPPGSPLRKLYGFREESESTHGVLDDTFRHIRMATFTSERQTLVMLARNTLARHALSKTRQLAP